MWVFWGYFRGLDRLEPNDPNGTILTALARAHAWGVSAYPSGAFVWWGISPSRWGVLIGPHRVVQVEC